MSPAAPQSPTGSSGPDRSPSPARSSRSLPADGDGPPQHGSPTPSWRERFSARLHLGGSPAFGSRTSLLLVDDPADIRRPSFRVTQAAKVLIQTTGDLLLPLASDLLELVPIPGLAMAAGVLDSIWQAALVVQSNQFKCLRLTDRCTDLLLAIINLVDDSGGEVALQLEGSLGKITKKFEEIRHYFEALAQVKLYKRFLKRDEILLEIEAFSDSITDYMGIFNGAIGLGVYQHVLKLEKQISAFLLAQSDPIPTQSPQSERLDPLDLAPDTRLLVPSSTEPEDAYVGTDADLPALRARLREQHALENRQDARLDDAMFNKLLDRAVHDESRDVAKRVLQIPTKEMSGIMLLLLEQLEMLQKTQKQPGAGAGATPPSPRFRSLTWPLDGERASRAEILRQTFIERHLDALKRTIGTLRVQTPNQSMAEARSILQASLGRKQNSIRVISPSNHTLVLSDGSSTSSIRSGTFSEQTISLAAPGTSTAMTTPAVVSSELPSEEPPSDFGAPEVEPDSEIDERTKVAVERALAPLNNWARSGPETLYRMSLSHAFHHLNVTVPLWTPTRVELGAVGFLDKPDGVFRTLFNSLDPEAQGIIVVPPLSEIPVEVEKQRAAERGVRGSLARGVRMVQHTFDSLAPSASASERGPSNIPPGTHRTYTVSAFGGTAHLITEKAEYKYWQSLHPAKRWFRDNIEAIMQANPGASFLKQEVLLVYGTVNARDHAMLVNQGDENEAIEVDFHVHSNRRPSAPWGRFASNSNSTSPGAQVKAKVSVVPKAADVERYSTVLLSCLRFRLDEKEPIFN